MTSKNIVGAIVMARWLLDAMYPKATFSALLPAVRDNTSCDIDEGALCELGMAFAGFGAIVRGDFRGVPAFGEGSSA